MGRAHEEGVSQIDFSVIPSRRGLISSVEGVARMAAAGLGLEEKTFMDAGRYG